MTTSATSVKKCARCNGKSSKTWHKVSGLDVGLECIDHVKDAAKRSGLKGNDLIEFLRSEYKEMMRITTVTGMILKGFLKYDDMIKKGKISEEQFVDQATVKYQGDKAKAIVKSFK